MGWITGQLNDQRKQGQAIQELHLMAHGSAEGIQLGDEKIDAASLLTKAQELSSWQIEKLVLWSCEIGKNQTLIQQLIDKSKAEVFSSHSKVNRNNAWLRSNRGQSIHASEIIKPEVLTEWEGDLTFTQIGNDLDGESEGDNLGQSVSLSNNGSIVAIGSHRNDGTGDDNGHVRIYQNVAGIWTQVGDDIDGEAEGDYSGYSVSLSDDGTVVAIGAPRNSNEDGAYSGHVRIYQNVAGTWTQVGDDIDGEAAGDQSGSSVSLSSDGSIVAIGAPWNDGNASKDGGHIRIYQNVAGTWTQVGDDIDGEKSGNLSGSSVSISGDGKVVAIGGPDNDSDNVISKHDIGHVRIYQNVAGSWTQVGDDIDGELKDDASGNAVSLSDDGSIVAIAATDNDGNGSSSGHVRIYQNIAGTWTQVGDDIDGEAAGDESGTSVSLSADGSRVAIGAIKNDGSGSNSGHVRIYDNIGGVWTQVGSDIDGEDKRDELGYSVSLSGDGSVIALGAPKNDGKNGDTSGHVRVFTSNGDIIAPTLSSSSPTDNSTGFAVGNNIVLNFSEVVDAESGNIVIKKSSDDSIVEVLDVTGSRVDGTGTSQITINPSRSLTSLTEYYIQIDATAFDDVSGNSYAGINDKTTLSFTSDTDAPSLSSFSPADNETDVALDSNIVLIFSEDVEIESGDIVIKKSSDNSIFETIDITSNQITGSLTDEITINPSTDFTASTEYYVQIASTAFKDSDDNSYAGIIDTTSLSFTTSADTPRVGLPIVQIGDDIDGKDSGDRFGSATSISEDGSIVAIAARQNDDNGSNSGHVRIYQNVAGTWTQVGDDIDGEAAGDQSGSSVSLSADGSVIAIGTHRNDGNGSDSGHVRIYENIAGTWTQVGDDIDGEAANDYSGYSVSLSEDGSIVAIGANQNDGNGTDSGHVRIYQNVAGNWTQVGNDINGEDVGDHSGYSVSLSEDGSVVAIGAPLNNSIGEDSGHVRIYQNIAGTWTQVGDDIDGEAAGDESGTSVSLSADGSIVAVGAHNNSSNGANNGHVRIYQNVAGIWTQVGNDIDGEAAGDESGTSVSLSDDGSIVAIGANKNDGNGFSSGHVRIYENINGTWTQIGSDVDGESKDDESGGSVSLSGDGSKVAIGAIYNGSNDTKMGHVSIFATSDVTAPSITGPSGSAGASTSTKSLTENTTTVHTFTANETVTWSLNGGADASLFNLASNGEMTFASAPDFENPIDNGTNNTYEVIVRATDGSTNTSDQTVTVTVNDLTEDGTKGNDIITGTSGNDSLTGDKGKDILSGLAGDDTLYGGKDNDTIDGGDGTDTAVFSSKSNKVDLRKTGRQNTKDGKDILTSIENVNAGKGNDKITGNDSDNVLKGEKGKDTLKGKGGDDTLYGGDDKDKIYGDNGEDTLYGESGKDTLKGGDGDDTLDGGDDKDKLYGGDDNDTLYGQGGKDTLKGDDGNDTLYGGASKDTLKGGEGRDTLYGGDDKDKLYGDANSDTLLGEAGKDTLKGGNGDDILTGGTGIDTCYGGNGDDVFVVSTGSGYDKIKDFGYRGGSDKIDISALGDTWSLKSSGDDVKLFQGDDLIAKIYDTDTTDLTQSGDYLI